MQSDTIGAAPSPSKKMALHCVDFWSEMLYWHSNWEVAQYMPPLDSWSWKIWNSWNGGSSHNIYKKRPSIRSDPMLRYKIVTCEVILNACVGIIEALNNACKYMNYWAPFWLVLPVNASGSRHQMAWSLSEMTLTCDGWCDYSCDHAINLL